MDIHQIIRIGLEQSGRDGLFVGGICACKKDDLSPGDCLSDICEAGYLHEHKTKPDTWIISPDNAPISDDEIETVIQECC